MSDSIGFKSAAELSDDARGALGSLLLGLADSKLLLGIRYSDWILGAPSVEAGISCSAMAQDEWGHARIVYAMLKDFDYDPDRLEHSREPGEYSNSELVDADVSGWPELLALNLLLDTSLSIQFESLQESRFEPVHYKARKLLEEERFHFEHARGWASRLGETLAGRAALEQAFSTAIPICLRRFGPDDDELAATLVRDGIVDGRPADLRCRWLARVGPVLESAGIGLVTAEDDGWSTRLEPDWGPWDASRRRGPGGPDEDTLARARGDRNRSLLMD
jgi:phenylacetate-CoA oxygenase PaaI subunit